jgi:hypothetical protein
MKLAPPIASLAALVSRSALLAGLGWAVRAQGAVGAKRRLEKVPDAEPAALLPLARRPAESPEDADAPKPPDCPDESSKEAADGERLRIEVKTQSLPTTTRRPLPRHYS